MTDYKKEIQAMVGEICNTGYLKMIYGFVRTIYAEDTRLQDKVHKQQEEQKKERAERLRKV